MPKTAAATSTEMSAQSTRAVTGGQRVAVNLLYDGVAFNPANLLTALTTQYGATKVFADTDALGNGVYNFRIIP